jgi:hypothetical protein
LANSEQAVAARLAKSPLVRAFVKNEFLGFTIPWIHNGQDHEYYPDYLVLEQVKVLAAQRWVVAVDAEGASDGGLRDRAGPARTVQTQVAWAAEQT